ncbi:MAG: hypothetical protein U5K37_12010 [Natrialbaceae archaeon]|nr:hypothetical protein [Natrialbaceae archaeon]
MQRHGSMDYPRLTKIGFLVGVAMFAIGTGGEFAGHAIIGELPAWENTLLFGLTAIGLVVAFFAPIIFGIVLPLTE